MPAHLLMAALLQATPAPVCPALKIEDSAPRPGETVFYLTADPAPRGKFGFNWSVSAGRIAAGQGSTNVAVTAPKGTMVTATVEVTGLPANCAAVASASVTIQ